MKRIRSMSSNHQIFAPIPNKAAANRLELSLPVFCDTSSSGDASALFAPGILSRTESIIPSCVWPVPPPATSVWDESAFSECAKTLEPEGGKPEQIGRAHV